MNRKKIVKAPPPGPAACPECFMVIAPAAARVMTSTGTFHRECYEARRERGHESRSTREA